jgi:hypothetical protein
MDQVFDLASFLAAFDFAVVTPALLVATLEAFAFEKAHLVAFAEHKDEHTQEYYLAAVIPASSSAAFDFAVVTPASFFVAWLVATLEVSASEKAHLVAFEEAFLDRPYN